MQAHAISGRGRRASACSSASARTRARPLWCATVSALADRLRGPWTAIYIETPRTQQLGEEARDRIAAALRLATSLGGEASVQPSAGRRIADDLLDYARAHNANHIVIGKSDRSRWFEIVNGSVVHDLVRRSGAISVHVIAGERLQEGAGKPRASRCRPSVAMRGGVPMWPRSPASPSASVSPSSASPIWGRERRSRAAHLGGRRRGAARHRPVDHGGRSRLARLQFLLPAAALHPDDRGPEKHRRPDLLRRRRDPGLPPFGARAGPGGDRAGSRPHHRCALSLQPQARRRRHPRRRAVGDRLPDRLHAQGSRRAPAARRGARHFGARRLSAEDRLNPPELAAAQWAFERNREAGRGADTLPGGRWLFLPMRTNRGAVGVAASTATRPARF